MTMDPRIEAALTAFARKKLLPPGYYVVCMHATWWSVRRDGSDWTTSADSEEDAIVKAWDHSDLCDTRRT